MTLPAGVQQYLSHLVLQLRALLRDGLVGVYGLGGLAFGDYRQGRSDLDIYVVVATPLEVDEKLSIATGCSHSVIPCPARQLELVVISAQAARQPTSAPRWELNLNTGADRVDHVGLDAAAEPPHWFVLDLAIGHQCGLALFGPPASQFIGMPPFADLQMAQSEAVAYYARSEMPAEAVVAACRAWHWHATGTFAAKRSAVGWALARLEDTGSTSADG